MILFLVMKYASFEDSLFGYGSGSFGLSICDIHIFMLKVLFNLKEDGEPLK